jgi:hypothetical protein
VVPSLLIAAASVAALGDTFTASGPPPAAASTTQTRSANREAVLPKLPIHSGTGRRIVFDESEQRVWLVAADGDAKRSYLVTGSNRGNVQPGFYAVKSRTRYARTYRGGGTLEYFVKFTQGRTAAIGFHAVTATRGGLVYARSDLGTPHTPGCVEAWRDDAKALWEFAPIGTKVVVTA